MRNLRRFIELLIILIAIGTVLYTQRVVLSEWVRERMKRELPVAVGYEEMIVEDERGAMSDQRLEDQEKPVEAEESGGVNQKENASEVLEIVEEVTSSTQTKAIPEAMNLAVPFTSQAPTGNWGEPFKEACEEASLLMAQAFFEGVKDQVIDAEVVVAELKKIVAFEMELFGSYEDTTAEQTNILAELLYGLSGEVIENPTIDQIKSAVAKGHPVLVPAAGRELGNPNFTAPGPIYHMLVIRGYTSDGKFITNDPGTKHGEAYLYDFDTLMKANHDWNGGNEILEGRKVMLELRGKGEEG